VSPFQSLKQGRPSLKGARGDLSISAVSYHTARGKVRKRERPAFSSRGEQREFNECLMKRKRGASLHRRGGPRIRRLLPSRREDEEKEWKKTASSSPAAKGLAAQGFSIPGKNCDLIRYVLRKA